MLRFNQKILYILHFMFLIDQKLSISLSLKFTLCVNQKVSYILRFMFLVN